MTSERELEAQENFKTFSLEVPSPLLNKKEAIPSTEKTSLYVETKYLNQEKVGFLPSSFSPEVFVTRNTKELLAAIFKYGDTAVRFGGGGLEEDPTRQQIIIYSLVLCQGHLLWYQRADKKAHGDARLRGKYSVGFGGHKTKEDISFSRDDLLFLRDILPAIQGEVGTMLGLKHGFFAEVQEEIGVGRDGVKDLKILGGFVDKRIEDPSLSVQVGAVHTGIAASLEVDPLVVPNLIFRKSEIAKAWWEPIEGVVGSLAVRQHLWEKGKGPKVETWSEIMIREFLKDARHKV